MRRRDFLVGSKATTLSAGAWACAMTTPVRDGIPGGEGKVVPASASTTADPFAQLRGLTTSITPVEPTERRDFVARAQALLRAGGHAAVVLEPGSDMQYLTGVRWGLSERPFLLVLPAEGDPFWIVPAFEEPTAREQLGASAVVLPWEEHENAYARVSEAIRARRGTVVLAPAMRLFVAEGIGAAIGSRRLERKLDVIGACRVRKTDRELARLRAVNEATKAALRVAAGLIEVGMTESQIADTVRRAQEAAGLEAVWVLALVGPNAAFPHGTRTGGVVVEGDLVLVDTGGSLHGYRSDITRTWAVGRPTDEARKVWHVVRDAQQAALEHIKPGLPCARAEAAARAVVEGAGFGPAYRHFTHRLGHGIGLDVHEHPYLVRGNDRKLEPGMTMSNEPGIYLRGSIGVRLEDIVAVTDDGNEVFGALAESLDRPFG